MADAPKWTVAEAYVYYEPILEAEVGRPLTEAERNKLWDALVLGEPMLRTADIPAELRVTVN